MIGKEIQDKLVTHQESLVENQSNKTIYKKKGKGVISIAPGENKVGQYDSIYLPESFI